MNHRWLASVLLAVALAACSAQQQRDAQSGALATTVAAKLATVDVNAATSVHVSSSGGAVTLTGRAQSADERDRYVQAARSVDGVTSVSDALSVDPHLYGIRQKTRDATLQVRVAAAIAAQAGVNVFHVTPTVRNGIVTLRGGVPSDAIEQTILSSAKATPGVKTVVNEMSVRK